jgi:hypothetical protein
MKSLHQAVLQNFGGFLKIPLDMTTKPRMVIKNAQGAGGMPAAPAIQNPQSAVMEVKMPQSVCILRLVAPHLSFL